MLHSVCRFRLGTEEYHHYQNFELFCLNFLLETNYLLGVYILHFWYLVSPTKVFGSWMGGVPVPLWKDWQYSVRIRKESVAFLLGNLFF